MLTQCNGVMFFVTLNSIYLVHCHPQAPLVHCHPHACIHHHYLLDAGHHCLDAGHHLLDAGHQITQIHKLSKEHPRYHLHHCHCHTPDHCPQFALCVFQCCFWHCLLQYNTLTPTVVQQFSHFWQAPSAPHDAHLRFVNSASAKLLNASLTL